MNKHYSDSQWSLGSMQWFIDIAIPPYIWVGSYLCWSMKYASWINKYGKTNMSLDEQIYMYACEWGLLILCYKNKFSFGVCKISYHYIKKFHNWFYVYRLMFTSFVLNPLHIPGIRSKTVHFHCKCSYIFSGRDKSSTFLLSLNQNCSPELIWCGSHCCPTKKAEGGAGFQHHTLGRSPRAWCWWPASREAFGVTVSGQPIHWELSYVSVHVLCYDYQSTDVICWWSMH